MRRSFQITFADLIYEAPQRRQDEAQRRIAAIAGIVQT
jgi:hypothetical protein